MERKKNPETGPVFLTSYVLNIKTDFDKINKYWNHELIYKIIIL